MPRQHKPFLAGREITGSEPALKTKHLVNNSNEVHATELSASILGALCEWLLYWILALRQSSGPVVRAVDSQQGGPEFESTGRLGTFG